MNPDLACHDNLACTETQHTCSGEGGAVSLWDETTGSVIGTYTSQQDALRQVAEWLDGGNADFVAGLALLFVTRAGCPRRPIRGQQLSALAKNR